jgi:hypothetical protein
MGLVMSGRGMALAMLAAASLTAHGELLGRQRRVSGTGGKVIIDDLSEVPARVWFARTLYKQPIGPEQPFVSKASRDRVEGRAAARRRARMARAS